MQYTRKQIIRYLETNQTATIPELSKYFNLTKGNIRHHIFELEEQGIVEDYGTLPKVGRGRPTKIYRIRSRAQDHNLDHLATSLLKILQTDLAQKEVTKVLERIATIMIGDYETSGSLIQKLSATIRWLSERNYKARWEVTATQPKITLGHCPYSIIVDENPQLCELDTHIISQLRGVKMKQVAKLERSPEGARQCIFMAEV